MGYKQRPIQHLIDFPSIVPVIIAYCGNLQYLRLYIAIQEAVADFTYTMIKIDKILSWSFSREEAPDSTSITVHDHYQLTKAGIQIECKCQVNRSCPLIPECGAGNARVKDCLEEHRNDAEFSSECKEEFEIMMEARATDYRLDSNLRENCAEDIEDVCGFQKVGLKHSKLSSCSLGGVYHWAPEIIFCRQTYDHWLQGLCLGFYFAEYRYCWSMMLIVIQDVYFR